MSACLYTEARTQQFSGVLLRRVFVSQAIQRVLMDMAVTGEVLVQLITTIFLLTMSHVLHALARVLIPRQTSVWICATMLYTTGPEMDVTAVKA